MTEQGRAVDAERKLLEGVYSSIEEYVRDHMLWSPGVEWRLGLAPPMVIVWLNDGRSRRIWIERDERGVHVKREDREFAVQYPQPPPPVTIPP